MKSQLRPHQEKAIQALRSSLGSGKRRPVLQAPTGAGKTVLSAAIVEMALAKGNRVVFCAPALSLIDQTVAKFYDEGITEVGVIQADHYATDWAKPVQVASVQTLERRPRPNCQLVIVDEAHRQFDFINKWMADPEWANTPFIGLSATPWARGMGKHWNDLIVASTTAELISKGFLSPFRVFAPAHPDLSGVKTVAGDYHEGQLAEAMNKGELVADIVSTWIKLGENRPTMAFCVDRAHAKSVQRDFEACGIPCGYIDAFTEALERKQIERQLERGEIKVVSSVGCLIIGVDWTFVSCVIWARPTKSEMLFVQGSGRGLRAHPGKPDCIFLDHADNHSRLGFVTDIHHEALNDGKPQKKSSGDNEKDEPLPKECSACTFLMPAKTRVCPNCGQERIKQSEIEVREGELAELKAKGANGRAKKQAFTREEKQSWYGGFIAMEIERGYKHGWASNQYRDKFGVWPQSLSKAARTPSPEMRSWIKSRQIAYAKRRQSEAANAPA